MGRLHICMPQPQCKTHCTEAGLPPTEDSAAQSWPKLEVIDWMPSRDKEGSFLMHAWPALSQTCLKNNLCSEVKHAVNGACRLPCRTS